MTDQMLQLAASLPRSATEATAASTLDMPTATLRQHRLNGTGPEHDTTVNGQTTYRRGHVLAWLHALQNTGKEL